MCAPVLRVRNESKPTSKCEAWGKDPAKPAAAPKACTSSAVLGAGHTCSAALVVAKSAMGSPTSAVGLFTRTTKVAMMPVPRITLMVAVAVRVQVQVQMVVVAVAGLLALQMQTPPKHSAVTT